jgi:pimeloyl-ACP methyl ester carboxylesterase
MRNALCAAVAATICSACGVPQRWVDSNRERQVAVADSVSSDARVRVEVNRLPGVRPDGVGDCEAIRRRAASSNRVELAIMAGDVERCRNSVSHDRQADSLVWAPYTITLSNGTEIAAEGSTLRVPAYRAARDSRLIELGFIRLRSKAPDLARPLLFLDGAPDIGPSSNTIRSAALFPFFQELRASRDVILMDYRGVGLSAPLQCPPVQAMPPDLYESRASGLRFFVEQARLCSDSLRAGGADLRGYTWKEVAADVDALRQGLGIPQVDLLGFSSGTHAALVALKHFAPGIGHVVLIGTEGPNHTRKLPSDVDRQLTRIGDLVRADSLLARQIPDFVATVRAVLTRAERRPFEVRVRTPSADSVLVPVGRYALAYIAAKNMSGPGEFDFLLRLFTTLAKEDVSMLTATMQRIYARPGAPNAVIALMDGSAGVSAARDARIRREASVAILGDAASFPHPDIGPAWGYVDLGEEYRAPFRSNVPALFITGALDGNTPPEQAEQVRTWFGESVHLVIPNAGHSTPFRMPDVARVIGTFLDGADVSGVRLAAPPLRLMQAR